VNIPLQPGQSLGLESVPNLRDLGGYTTQDGQTVRRGLVYRADQLNPVSDADLDTIAALGVKTDFDLRRAEEAEDVPDVLPPGVTRVSLDVLADGTFADPAKFNKLMSDPATAAAAFSHGRSTSVILTVYRQFIELPSAKQAYRDLFAAIANDGCLPALFHCASGKDRTGWAAAALLTLLGVSRKDVMEDYLRSNDYVLPRYAKTIEAFVAAGGDRELLAPLLEVRAEYLELAFAEMERQYGSIERYFGEALGIDEATQAALRQRLLE
jgi:protein-tyrosine phosphatase